MNINTILQALEIYGFQTYGLGVLIAFLRFWYMYYGEVKEIKLEGNPDPLYFILAVSLAASLVWPVVLAGCSIVWITRGSE